MLGLSWNKLTDIIKTVKPYRGTTNRYPLANRAHNTKNFYVEKIDGEQVCRITYGTGYKEIFITKEVYDTDPVKYHDRSAWVLDPDKTYCRYEPYPHELGVLRSDNTFEFTANHYGQGDNLLLSSYSEGCFRRSSRHGGMIYSQTYYSNNKVFHPIFKGLRVYCDTMRPHKDSVYKVIGKKVNRKKSNAFLKHYEDFYKINEVMLKTIPYNNYIEIAREIVKTMDFKNDQWRLRDENLQQMLDFAHSNMKDAPLDAGIAFALAYDIKSIYQRTHLDKLYWANSELNPETIFTVLKRKLNHEFFLSNPSVMTLVEHKMGERYPANHWGVDIYVDNKRVEQY